MPDSPSTDVTGIHTREDLAAALTALRERRGWTIRDVAQAAGIPVATTGGYFSGRHLPPLATFDQFVQMLVLLGVGPGELPQWSDAVQRLRRVRGPRPASSVAPYRGLAAYQAEDAELFFGREELTDTLLARVQAGGPTPVVVLGASGSGKSSLLRAGLVARLRVGGRDAVVMTPGPEPMTALAEAEADLARRTGAILVVDQFEEAFTADRPEVVTDLVAALAAIHGAGTVVVLGMRADFFDRALALEQLGGWLAAGQVLVGPLTAGELRRVVVEPARAVGLEVDEALVEVLLVEATSGSAHGAALDPGVLPLLSHALYVSWQASSGRRLTLAQYRLAGGLEGAITQTAEAVYAALTDEQREVARATLTRLVQLRAGLADTRRPARRREFGSPQAAEVIRACVDARLLSVDQEFVQLAHEALLTAWPRLRGWIEDDREGLRTRSRLADSAHRWWDADREPDLLYRGAPLSGAVERWGTGADPAALVGVEREFLDASVDAELTGVLARQRASMRLRVLAGVLAVLFVTTAGLAGLSVRQNRTLVLQKDLAVSRQLAVTAQTLAATDPGLAGQLAVGADLTADTVEARSALLSSSGRTAVSQVADVDALINAIDVSPDGTILAAATDASMLRFWSTSGGRDLASVPVDDTALYSVAFSPDGGRVAAGGDSGHLEVWSTSDPAAPTPLAVADEAMGTTIYGVAFDPGGSLVAAAAADGTVRVWTASGSAGYALAATIPAFDGTAQAVVLGPDGGLLVAAGSDGIARLWDVSDPRAPSLLGDAGPAVGSTITSLDLSPDGHLLVAGTTGGEVHRWDVAATGAPVELPTLSGPASWVNDVSFSADGTDLAAAGSDDHLWVWDGGTGALEQSLPHPSTLLGVAWAPDGQTLYSAGSDGTARAWAYPGPVLAGLASIPGQGAFGPGILVTSTKDGLRVWDDSVAGHRSVLSLSPPPDGARLDGAVAVSASLGLAVAGDTTGGLHFWDLRDPRAPRFLRSVQAHTTWVDSVSFDRSGTRLAATSDDASITLWDLADGVPTEPTSRLADLGGFVYSASFSPDATTLVASVLSGSVLLVDVADLARPTMIGMPLTGPVGYVYCATFSPDGRTIAASGNDSSIWLWDVSDREHPAVLGAPILWADGYATNVTFSPDGRLLAAGMTDGTVRLWDVTATRAPVRWATLTGTAGTVYGVEFSPDGSRLSAAGSDREVRVFSTSLEDARSRVCAGVAAGSPASAAEWARVAESVPVPDLCG